MRVLVVDGYGVGGFLADCLHEWGAEVLHVRSSARSPAFYRRSLQVEKFDIDLGHRPEFTELVDELRQLAVVQVVAATEPGVHLAELLADALNLPGNEVTTAVARRDKYALAQRLAAVGLNTVRSQVVVSSAEARDYYCGVGGVAVVKPTSSAGTDSVRFCNTVDEVVHAVDQVLVPHRNFLGLVNQAAVVQEYLTGAEYYVNTVSSNGAHYVVECWAYRKRTSYVGSPIYDFVVPVDLNSVDVRRVVEYLEQALTAIGVRNGPVHSEVIVTDRGPVLIDVGARLGGSSLPELVQRLTGTSHPGATARMLVDRTGAPPLDSRKFRWGTRTVRHVVLINHVEDTVRSEDYTERLRELPTFKGIVTYLRVGDLARETVDLATSPGFVYLVGSEVEVLADYARIRELELRKLYTE